MKDYVFSDETLKQTMRLLGTSYEAIFQSEDATAAGLPSISHGSVVVGPGDVKLVSADDDVALLVGLILAHSVLNVRFATGKRAFLSYVQKYMMSIDDGCPVPQKVLRFHQQTAGVER